MKLKVTVTKEYLKQSMMCGTISNLGCIIAENCAVAIAIKSIFPNAFVSHKCYYINHGISAKHNGESFIYEFDSLVNTPHKRLELPETEIELEITDEILDELNKNVNWKEIVNNSNHLELI